MEQTGYESVLSKCSRPIPVDMQGFAINVRRLLEHSGIWFEGGGAYTDMGYIEASRFIYQFVTNTSLLECRTRMNEVLYIGR